MQIQPDMFPIKDDELFQTMYRQQDLLDAVDEAVANFKLTQDEHKDHLKALKREINDCKLRIKLARQQRHATPAMRQVMETVVDQVNDGALDREGMTVTASMQRARAE